MKWYHALAVFCVIGIVVYLLWKAWKEFPISQAVETAQQVQESLARVYPPATRTVLFPTWSPTWVASPMTIPAQYLGEQLGKLLWGQR